MLPEEFNGKMKCYWMELGDSAFTKDAFKWWNGGNNFTHVKLQSPQSE